MSEPTVLENILVIKSTSDKIWKIDRDDGKITLYANMTKYDANEAVGTIDTKEIREVYEFIRGMDRQ